MIRVSAFLVTLSAGLAAAGPALATRGTDPNRMLLLAAEAASASQASGVGVRLAPWGWAVAIAGILLSAFAGGYLTGRRLSMRQVRAHDDWREVTYRFRASGPLRFGNEMVQLLGGVAAELERLAHRRSRGNAPVPAGEAPRTAEAPEAPPIVEKRPREAPLADTPIRGARGDRTEAYRRARQLLGQGHDAWTVRERTGLKFAEIDLLASTTGQPPTPKPGATEANP